MISKVGFIYLYFVGNSYFTIESKNDEQAILRAKENNSVIRVEKPSGKVIYTRKPTTQTPSRFLPTASL
jgi:hypothetical protein